MKLRHVLLAVAPICLVLTASPNAQAVVTLLNDGGVHTFNSVNPDPNEGFEVANNGVTPTTVNVVAGADIGGDPLEEYSFLLTQDSSFSMSGGTTALDVIFEGNSTGTFTGGTAVDNITADGDSTVTIVDLDLAGDDIEAVGNSFMEVFDGTFVEDVQAEDDAKIVIHGGQFMVGGPDSRGGFIEPDVNGVIEILGGEFGVGAAGDPNWAGSVVAHGNSTVIIKGGTHHGGGALFTDADDWPFGLADLVAETTSTIYIYGSGFQVNGSPVLPGPIPNIAGDVSGILADSTPFDLSFSRDFLTGAQIVLVPEPASMSLVLLGLVGFAARRRK